jgi:hypothetical protein
MCTWNTNMLTHARGLLFCWHGYVRAVFCNICVHDANWSQNGVVNKLDDPGLESWQVQNIQICSGAHQSPIQCVEGIKWRGHETYHSPPSSAEIKNEWRYTSAPLTVHGVCKPNFT